METANVLAAKGYEVDFTLGCDEEEAEMLDEVSIGEVRCLRVMATFLCQKESKVDAVL